MRLRDFLAEPSGRYITDSTGRAVLRFEGIPTGELHKRILLTAVHLRPLMAEYQASSVGRSPIPADQLVPPIRAAVAYLGRLAIADTAAMANAHWRLARDAIMEGNNVIAIVQTMNPPEDLADLVATAPRLCAAALQIAELGVTTTDISELLEAA